ncbi:hypothetical protein [Ktedonobacter racemifer]|uniref:hypothetical protein n=1 Tax=Ktedonobacter racemifer TaxID=363277 RepID=UPI00146D662B|nr:hypothetical protein [Ktedonobacter racemifer]
MAHVLQQEVKIKARLMHTNTSMDRAASNREKHSIANISSLIPQVEIAGRRVKSKYCTVKDGRQSIAIRDRRVAVKEQEEKRETGIRREVVKQRGKTTYQSCT